MEKTVCELFAGVGGFRCGLNSINTIEDTKKEEKWNTVWFSQWEPEKKKQWAHDCYVNRFGTSLDLNGNVEEAKESNKYYYCFKENKNNKGLIYYDIQVFYRFNLPVIGNIALYKISGVTKSFVGSDDRI